MKGLLFFCVVLVGCFVVTCFGTEQKTTNSRYGLRIEGVDSEYVCAYFGDSIVARSSAWKMGDCRVWGVYTTKTCQVLIRQDERRFWFHVFDYANKHLSQVELPVYVPGMPKPVVMEMTDGIVLAYKDCYPYIVAVRVCACDTVNKECFPMRFNEAKRSGLCVSGNIVIEYTSSNIVVLLVSNTKVGNRRNPDFIISRVIPFKHRFGDGGVWRDTMLAVQKPVMNFQNQKTVSP